jgi:hypothetical protein
MQLTAFDSQDVKLSVCREELTRTMNVVLVVLAEGFVISATDTNKIIIIILRTRSRV